VIRVGFTYDAKADYLALGYNKEQVAEFDCESTLAALAETIERLGFHVDRIGHVKHLVARLAKGERWDMVFNIAEGMHGAAREATIPALLDAYGIPYTFADAVTMATTLDKSIAKKLVAAQGIPTATYAVVKSKADAQQVALPFPLFVKPLAEGSGKGVLAESYVTTKSQLVDSCATLLERFAQPVLVESFLSGREFTVGLLGEQVIGVLEVHFQRGAKESFNSFQNKQQDLEEYVLVDDPEAQKAAEVALAAWQALGGRDAGRIDLRSDGQGQPHFLEMNPLAGLTQGYSELPILAEKAGLSFAMLIEGILRSATMRHSLGWPTTNNKRRSA
jgi:D-alanine-D-alanine ligase